MSASRAGYTPIAQSIDEADEEPDVQEVDAGSSTKPMNTTTRGRRRPARPGSIDLKKLDNAFKRRVLSTPAIVGILLGVSRWTESIAQKVKRKKKADPTHERRPIWHSVFEPQVIVNAVPSALVKTLDHKPPMTQAAYDVIVQSVQSAISEGIHPKMITKGSSGSYFARAKVDGRVQTVAVFKPKDEEPYGRLNPKTTKWLHRQFRWIIPFGRSCLIPNLSYISEAAASLLDNRLALYIVPPTQLVSLSSPAFFYDWLDRSAAKKGKPLPEKIGSMQYFLHGYQDASDFLRKHPWPGRAIADTFDDSSHRQRNLSKRFLNTLKIVCGRTGDIEDVYDADYDDDRVLYDASESNISQRPFYWSQTLQRSFREELEKLVILDYLMLNTDRGADNYMIRYCEGDHEKSLVDVAPSRAVRKGMPVMSELRREASSSAPSMTTSSPYFASPVPSETSIPPADYTRTPHIHIAAIDNSLSFPHEHPQGWRSYTYGWLYLPVSVIGRPFSEKTRSHFLPLLTSKAWWEETTFQLEKLFAVDPDFHPKMFRRQLAVIKGQAWNIVQSLKHSDEGPLELTRRKPALVWDDELEISDDALESQHSTGPAPASPTSATSVPVPRRTRSYSSGGEFPPPIRRTSTDVTGAPRPVSFSTKFQRVHPGTTGVTVLEHLERLDAVEASLQRLGVEEPQEEADVGVAVRPSRSPMQAPGSPTASSSNANLPTSPFSPPGSPLPTVHEVSDSASSIAEEDVAAMSKSMSHVEVSPSHAGRQGSALDMDWMHTPEPSRKRMVVAERMEIVNKKPLCSCW
ncbi:putative phosphatidylinositol 3- and 4-kinase [Lyophyllum shimeji]|uniref:Phosphatidylinositol 4-kinase n=1 Tax=Lyophyllum shimeji TaxID=47721 RepID=A0A9P3UJL2_LYOSH|nr:putative phosphatidylinositol 3- and 4-kinase [Lyophyllum shimeji]